MNPFAALGLLVLAFLAPIANGFALSWLWFWFITPLGVPVIGTAHAIGISMIARWVTDHNAATKERTPAELAGLIIFMPLLALGFGWLAHLFM